MAVNWPTHKCRARLTKSFHLRQAKVRRKLRRLNADGKRGEMGA